MFLAIFTKRYFLRKTCWKCIYFHSVVLYRYGQKVITLQTSKKICRWRPLQIRVILTSKSNFSCQKTPRYQFSSKYWRYFRNYLEKFEIKMKLLHPVSPKLSILGHTFIRTFLLIFICRICCRSFRNTVRTTLYV